MKSRESRDRKFNWFVVVATAAVFFGLLQEGVYACVEWPKGSGNNLCLLPPANPMSPHREVSMNYETGRFNFDKLKPGKYVLRIVPSQAKINHNSSRSNKTSSIGPGGVEVHNVSIELRMEKQPKPFAPIEIEISAKQGGRVTGQITLRSVAIKEEGVK